MADLSTRPESTTDAATGEVGPDAPVPPTPSNDTAENAAGASSESPTASEPTPAAPAAASGPKADVPEADGSEPGSRAEEADKADKSAAVPADSTVESAAAPATTHAQVPDTTHVRVPATESDGPGSDGPSPLDTTVPARRRRSRPSALVTSLAALLVVLVGTGVALMLHNRALTSVAEDRGAALQAAQNVAINLTTFSPDDVASQIQTLNTESTGSFRDQIAGYSEAFQAVLKQGNVASKGTVSAAGIEKLDGDTAAAVVTVAARLVSAQNPQGEPRSYRLTIELQRNDDKWLASNVNFVQ